MKSNSMRGLYVLWVMALMVLVMRANPVLAQGTTAGALPSARSLIERHLEAVGGPAALAKITNRVSSGTLLIKPMNIKGSIVSYQALPNKIYTRLEIDQLGVIERGCDGKVFWEKNSLSGPRVMRGEERALMMVLTRMDLRDYATLFEKMETQAMTKVEGEACYEVALTPEGTKRPLTLEFSKETGLLVRMVTNLPSQQGDIVVENLIGDYAKVDGVLVPRQTREKALNVETQIVLTMIKQNVKLDAATFTLPEDVRQAMAKSPGGLSIKLAR